MMKDPHVGQAVVVCTIQIRRALTQLRAQLGKDFQGTISAQLNVTPLENKHKPVCLLEIKELEK